MQVPQGVGLSVAVADSFVFWNKNEVGLSLLRASEEATLRP